MTLPCQKMGRTGFRSFSSKSTPGPVRYHCNVAQTRGATLHQIASSHRKCMTRTFCMVLLYKPLLRLEDKISLVCSKQPLPPSSGTSVRGFCRVAPSEHFHWPNPAESTRAPDPFQIIPDLAPKIATFASRYEVHKQWPGGRGDSAGFGQSNAIWPEPSSRRFPSGSSRVSQTTIGTVE